MEACFPIILSSCLFSCENSLQQEEADLGDIVSRLFSTDRRPRRGVRQQRGLFLLCLTFPILSPLVLPIFFIVCL